MVGMLLLIGLAALSTTEDEATIAGNEMQEMRAFYAAEAGLERAAAQIQSEYDSTGMPPMLLPSGTQALNGCDVSFSVVDDGPAGNETITRGSYAGLYALSKTFSMASVATNEVDRASVQVSQTFQTLNIPIFQWAIFYNDDLWVEPVYDMNIDGRVHGNGDMFIRSAGSGKTFLFEDRITCAGDIHHGFPWVGSAGDVQFTDAQGNAVSMNQGGTWIDSDHPDWRDTAVTLWGGMVQDQSHGQEALNLPLDGTTDPHKMIERSAGNPDSFQNKAGFMVIDGVPMAQVAGVWQDVSGVLPAGTITSDGSVDFYDQKEKTNVQTTQIDIAKLKGSGFFPSNGIIYVSDQRNTGDMPGTSLVNGDEVGAPMTVATENPLYVTGDFNTIDKQPVATMADAITFLSNDWDPALSASYYRNRVPTPTEVNLCFITGDVEADVAGHNHQGGLENLPRFLEDWRGREFKIRGSMIQMWHSQYATADYTYAQYYTAPSRNWGFDTDLEDPNKLPPGTPQVRVFQRTGWKQEYVGYDSEL